MKHTDLRDGMKIRAVADWCDCWKADDEFVVKMDTGPGHDPMPYVECHDPDNGGHHTLDAMDDGDGELPEFEPVAG